MKTELTLKKEFEKKVHNSKDGMLLLFYSDNSPKKRLKNYIKEAEDKCGTDYPVFTINIDKVFLSEDDVQKYQEGVVVICCTVLMNDKVRYKELNPRLMELMDNIICG